MSAPASAHEYRTVVYNADAVARTTIRETMEGNPRQEGFLTGGQEGAYSFVRVDIDPTQRQFMSDKDYYGASQSAGDFRPPTGEAEAHMHTNANRELLDLDASRAPTASGVMTALPKEGINMTVSRVESDEVAPRAGGNPDGSKMQATIIPSSCETTRAPQTRTVEDNRLDPNLLAPFLSNPYTKPLNSVA